MSGAGMQTVREHWKKMWCRRTGALPQFSYGLVVVHGASPTVRLVCGGAYGGGEGESRPHPKHQGRQVANTSACHVCIAQSIRHAGRPFLNSEVRTSTHPGFPGPPLVTQPGVQNPFSRARHTSSANVVLCELRCCHGSAPRSATGRTMGTARRHHHHVASNDPSVCTPPDCPRPLRIPTASAHGRGGRSYRPPASLARVLSRPLLTSSVAATRASKQS